MPSTCRTVGCLGRILGILTSKEFQPVSCFSSIVPANVLAVHMTLVQRHAIFHHLAREGFGVTMTDIVGFQMMANFWSWRLSQVREHIDLAECFFVLHDCGDL